MGVVNGGKMKCDDDEGGLFDGSEGYVTTKFTDGVVMFDIRVSKGDMQEKRKAEVFSSDCNGLSGQGVVGNCVEYGRNFRVFNREGESSRREEMATHLGPIQLAKSEEDGFFFDQFNLKKKAKAYSFSTPLCPTPPFPPSQLSLCYQSKLSLFLSGALFPMAFANFHGLRALQISSRESIFNHGSCHTRTDTSNSRCFAVKACSKKPDQNIHLESKLNWVLDSVKWDEKGLAVAIAQNVDSGAILMQGFANRDALATTIASKKATFYSRSRSSLWIKGETSLNFINVHDIFLDCDRDSVSSFLSMHVIVIYFL
ncbi:unnamed protein product [Lactuca saligna]|uniref:phosphoribosyl-AMP cyclohydrolase n=1 Tax=Lactuca saligna TaxID=75948 RepID=A0AA36EPX4_LACSI|nr:unnamed protein product [Lactuca saligna]